MITQTIKSASSQGLKTSLVTVGFCLFLQARLASGADLPTGSEPALQASEPTQSFPPYSSRFDIWHPPTMPQERSKAIIATLKDDKTGIEYNLVRHDQRNLIRLITKGESSDSVGEVWWQGVLGINDGIIVYQEEGHVGLATVAGQKIGRSYDDAQMFSEGLAAVEIDSKWGFIDRGGVEVIAPSFDAVGKFIDGFAPVESDGHWGYIDKHGKTVVGLLFESAFNIEDEVATVVNNKIKGTIKVSNFSVMKVIDDKNPNITWSKDGEVDNEVLGMDPTNIVYETDDCIVRDGFIPRNESLSNSGLSEEQTTFEDSFYQGICDSLAPDKLVLAQIFFGMTINNFGTSVTIIDVESKGCRGRGLVYKKGTSEKDIAWGDGAMRCFNDTESNNGPNSLVWTEPGPRRSYFMVCDDNWHVVYNVSFESPVWPSLGSVCYPESGSTRCSLGDPKNILLQQCAAAK
jgi:hypothetical protein